MSKYYQGKYNPQKPEKYIGSIIPTYRSGWELTAFKWADSSNKVKKWGSEVLKIPYISIDNRPHNYIPDLYLEIEDNNGNIQKYIAEIKPHGQGPSADSSGNVKTPVPPKNNNPKALKRYINEMLTWKKNAAKWQATKIFCKSHNIKFVILSDEDFLI
jgi:hypothetical protein